VFVNKTATFQQPCILKRTWINNIHDCEPMSAIQTITYDNEAVGILVTEDNHREFRFHSGLAPYDLLDGSRFSSPALANQAVRRIAHAAKGGPRVKARGLDEKNRSHCSSGAT
jgi:hypothetical protein